jgi:hypothetical protein
MEQAQEAERELQRRLVPIEVDEQRRLQRPQLFFGDRHQPQGRYLRPETTEEISILISLSSSILPENS